MAGNQLGKSQAGAFEVARHLTGQYPDRWKARHWDRAVIGWAGGERSNAVAMFREGSLPRHRFPPRDIKRPLDSAIVAHATRISEPHSVEKVTHRIQ